MQRVHGSLRKRSAVLSLLVVLSGGGMNATAQRDNSGAALEREYVASLLNVESASISRLLLQQTADQSVQANVEIDGVKRTVLLTPHSVRAPGFTVRIPLADGTYGEIEPPPSKTFRGTVIGIPGSQVAASMKDDGLFARVILPDDTERWIEPLALRDARFAADEYAVYHGSEVIPSGGTCDALPAPAEELEEDAASGETASVARSGGTSFIAEVAVDMDVEFYNDFGSAEAAIDHIENIFNVMNLQYMRDLETRHDITSIIVRDSEPDPYSSFSAGTLLNQFRSHWNSSQTGVSRDIAHLFTGKEIDGSTIGIAWVGVICSSSLGYGLVQPNCCGSLACKTDLSAHELGHNWSSGHCSCSGWSMNSSLQCANRFNPTDTIPGMESYRNSRSCLTQGAPFPCASLSAPSADLSVAPTNRYLALNANNPGQFSAIRVILHDLPAPFDVANGTTMWLGPPEAVSENSGIKDPDAAPGFATFLQSTLRCAPSYLDWASFGTIHVAHEFIIPGGVYHFQEVDAVCTFDGESVYTPVLELATSPVWADVVENCETLPCGPPDGSVNITTDLVAVLDKFKNQPGAPLKSRVDLIPQTPDGVVGIQEITRTLDAFGGAAYPYLPGTVPCN